MKKLIGIFIIFSLCFTGCNSNSSPNENENNKKKSKIEIYSVENGEDTFLKIIDNQETINEFLNTENWKSEDNLPENLIPEYKIFVYQEKTLTLGQNSDEEREYELIETITTFQDNSYIQDVISNNVITTAVPEDALIFYYFWNEDTMREFNNFF